MPSDWEPLRQPLFRALWLAALASNFGTWIHEVGADWLTTSLSTSPLLVSLVETATSLPVFLVSLVAGALADVVDRHRLLLFTQFWMLLAAAGLGILTLADGTTPWGLLGFTFFLNIGAAWNGPAWLAIVPELVARDEIPSAVALNSVGFNIARSVGPALGRLVVAHFGSGMVFLLNAAHSASDSLAPNVTQEHPACGARARGDACRHSIRALRRDRPARVRSNRAVHFLC